MGRSCWRELGINRSRLVFWAAARWNVEARFARFATKVLRALRDAVQGEPEEQSGKKVYSILNIPSD
jgi:hypothetical protein